MVSTPEQGSGPRIREEKSDKGAGFMNNQTGSANLRVSEFCVWISFGDKYKAAKIGYGTGPALLKLASSGAV